MSVVFYAGFICGDVYRLVIVRFEVSAYAGSVLRRLAGNHRLKKERVK